MDERADEMLGWDFSYWCRRIKMIAMDGQMRRSRGWNDIKPQPTIQVNVHTGFLQ